MSRSSAAPGWLRFLRGGGDAEREEARRRRPADRPASPAGSVRAPPSPPPPPPALPVPTFVCGPLRRDDAESVVSEVTLMTCRAERAAKAREELLRFLETVDEPPPEGEAGLEGGRGECPERKEGRRDEDGVRRGILVETRTFATEEEDDDHSESEVDRLGDGYDGLLMFLMDKEGEEKDEGRSSRRQSGSSSDRDAYSIPTLDTFELRRPEARREGRREGFREMTASAKGRPCWEPTNMPLEGAGEDGSPDDDGSCISQLSHESGEDDGGSLRVADRAPPSEFQARARARRPGRGRVDPDLTASSVSFAHGSSFRSIDTADIFPPDPPPRLRSSLRSTPARDPDPLTARDPDPPPARDTSVRSPRAPPSRTGVRERGDVEIGAREIEELRILVAEQRAAMDALASRVRGLEADNERLRARARGSRDPGAENAQLRRLLAGARRDPGDGRREGSACWRMQDA